MSKLNGSFYWLKSHTTVSLRGNVLGVVALRALLNLGVVSLDLKHNLAEAIPTYKEDG